MFFVFLNAGLVLFLMIFCVWLLYLKTKNPSIIDVFWSLGIWGLGFIYLYLDRVAIVRDFILLVCLSLWAFRLSAYLFWERIRLGHVDKRYIKLSASWRFDPRLGFLLNYYLQGCLMIIVSLPLYYICRLQTRPFSLWELFPIALILVGIAGEAYADHVLKQFRTSGNDGVCREGPWAYSRHPNYFFELLVWMGFATWGMFNFHHGWVGLASPIVLYSIMRFVTGPLTESMSLESRGESYRNYQSEVPMIFPKRCH